MNCFGKKIRRAKRIKAIREARERLKSKNYPDFVFSEDIWAYGNYEVKTLSGEWIKVFDSSARDIADIDGVILRRTEKS